MDSQKYCNSCPYFDPVDYVNRDICMCRKENKLISVEPKYFKSIEYHCAIPSWCDEHD